MLAGGLDGVLADEVVLHEDGLVHSPEHLSDEEASTLGCAAVTAWHALFAYARTQPGETILVQGTGGVSVFALQFGLLGRGARYRHLEQRHEARAHAVARRVEDDQLRDDSRIGPTARSSSPAE